VRGVTLDRFIAKQTQQLQQQSQEPAAGMFVQDMKSIMRLVCVALNYLHSRRPSIVHSDIKPCNVMIESTESGPRTKLLDFGLSRMVTRRSVMLGGTPEYIAPEVARGCTNKPSPAIDIFAFGNMLLYITSGGRSGEGTPDQRLACNALMAEWKGIISMCLAAESWRRPTAAALHVMLSSGTATRTTEHDARAAQVAGTAVVVEGDPPTGELLNEPLLSSIPSVSLIGRPLAL